MIRYLVLFERRRPNVVEGVCGGLADLRPEFRGVDRMKRCLSMHDVLHNDSPFLTVLFPLPLPTLQQKNTCAHNSTHKAHANGIKKAKRQRYVSLKGVDPKFLRNQKFAKRKMMQLKAASK